jgi:hypothetical protein
LIYTLWIQLVIHFMADYSNIRTCLFVCISYVPFPLSVLGGKLRVIVVCTLWTFYVQIGFLQQDLSKLVCRSYVPFPWWYTPCEHFMCRLDSYNKTCLSLSRSYVPFPWWYTPCEHFMCRLDSYNKPRHLVCRSYVPFHPPPLVSSSC